MSSTRFQKRVEALRAEAAQLGADLAAEATSMEPDELFELTGQLQGVSNAVEGAQLVAIAHAGSHEHVVTERGIVDTHRGLGFVDAMTSTEVSLATGLGQWAAGRRVGLAAALSARFPRLLTKVVAGELATVNVGKVVSACDGLDDGACAAVEAVLAERLVGMDPARITGVARRVAARVAADQVDAAARKNRTDRCVQVAPGPVGTTDWWARLPAARSAAAWAAVTDLAATYARKDESLSVDQARADAFLDLLLTNVTVTAQVTLGIPVVTGADAEVARDAAVAQHLAEGEPAGPESAGLPLGGPARPVDTPPCGARPATATGGLGPAEPFSLSAALLSGCELPGIGFIEAATVEALLAVVPTEIGRALLDARTGTLVESVSDAYRPTRGITDFVTTRDGTCRMWGCDRPARRCDLDHARPWPNGPTSPANLAGLCRRHHRLKQRRRWPYHLAPDGTATWTSPNGTRRVTEPAHVALPPPADSRMPQPTASAPPGGALDQPPF